MSEREEGPRTPQERPLGQRDLLERITSPEVSVVINQQNLFPDAMRVVDETLLNIREQLNNQGEDEVSRTIASVIVRRINLMREYFFPDGDPKTQAVLAEKEGVGIPAISQRIDRGVQQFRRATLGTANRDNIIPGVADEVFDSWRKFLTDNAGQTAFVREMNANLQTPAVPLDPVEARQQSYVNAHVFAGGGEDTRIRNALVASGIPFEALLDIYQDSPENFEEVLINMIRASGVRSRIGEGLVRKIAEKLKTIIEGN